MEDQDSAAYQKAIIKVIHHRIWNNLTKNASFFEYKSYQ